MYLVKIEMDRECVRRGWEFFSGWNRRSREYVEEQIRDSVEITRDEVGIQHTAPPRDIEFQEGT